MTKSSPSSGFTLIELLVVIAIIAVLMGLLFPVVNGVKDQANKAKAKSDITQIVTAVRAYYTEYGKYPADPNLTQGKDIAVSTSTAIPQYDLLNTLRASGTSVTGVDMNPRKVVFIEPPIVKDPANPKGGIIPANGSKFTPGTWVDPWGTPYRIAMDTNYDNQLNDSGNAPAGEPFYNDTSFQPINTGVIAWCFGKDTVLGSKSKGGSLYDNGNSDDVISWQ